MKRYDPIEKLWCGGTARGTMEEDANGDFVRYEDMRAALNAVPAAIEALEGMIARLDLQCPVDIDIFDEVKQARTALAALKGDQ